MSADQTSQKTIRILVIDDDPFEVKALTTGLGSEGFEVDGVEDGERALTMLAAKKYAAALIDLMMPGINGLQLARRIRDEHPSVATFLMSAYHLSPVQLAKADTGVVGFIPKPFRFPKVVSYLNGKISEHTAS